MWGRGVCFLGSILCQTHDTFFLLKHNNLAVDNSFARVKVGCKIWLKKNIYIYFFCFRWKIHATIYMVENNRSYRYVTVVIKGLRSRSYNVRVRKTLSNSQSLFMVVTKNGRSKTVTVVSINIFKFLVFSSKTSKSSFFFNFFLNLFGDALLECSEPLSTLLKNINHTKTIISK